jgi:hypothetical protein
LRARLTIRGFKDQEADLIDGYSGTSSRWAQRLITSTAAQRRWPLGTLDVSKAFLQGISYDELEAETGFAREINFELNKNDVEILQQLPGFEDFDPVTEVLHCDKPGTGSKDAPAAFAKRLAQVTHGIGCVPVAGDNQLEQLRVDNELVMLIGKHVDDIKFTGHMQCLKKLIHVCEEAFGKLKINWFNFANCGLKYAQDEKTFEVEVDQNHFALTLKPIPVAASVDENALVSPAGQHDFISLLGAVAYLAMTRVDVCVFIAALQRFNSKPASIHMKRLNALLRWIQRNPKGLHYSHIEGDLACLGLSDSAFKREDDSGHAMRGYLIGLSPCTTGHLISSLFHLIEWSSRKQRHVCRSTFAAELFSCNDCLDMMYVIAAALHELTHGCQGADVLRQIHLTGQYACPLIVAIDAYSIFSAIAMDHLKIPAEKSLLVQLQWLKEQLLTKKLKALVWLDTRDMCSDGLTKGSIDREALHNIMSGHLHICHENQVTPKP